MLMLHSNGNGRCLNEILGKVMRILKFGKAIGFCIRQNVCEAKSRNYHELYYNFAKYFFYLNGIDNSEKENFTAKICLN